MYARGKISEQRVIKLGCQRQSEFARLLDADSVCGNASL